MEESIFTLKHYYEDYYLIDFSVDMDTNKLRHTLDALQANERYNGLFIIVHEKEKAKISKAKELGFHYDDTLLEYALSNGPGYICYSRYRSIDKKLTKE